MIVIVVVEVISIIFSNFNINNLLNSQLELSCLFFIVIYLLFFIRNYMSCAGRLIVIMPCFAERMDKVVHIVIEAF